MPGDAVRACDRQTAPEVAMDRSCTAEECARRYRCAYGFAAEVDSRGRIVVCAGPVGAVLMPRPLGVSVVTALCDSGRPVPAVSHTASVVALLTDSTAAETPQRSGRVDTAAGVRQRRLWCRGVVWVRGGAPIVLPYPGDPRRRWLQPPNGSTITAGDAAIVIAAAIESEEAAAAAHARANRRERVHAR